MTDVAAVNADLDKLEAKIKAFEATPAASSESADLDKLCARIQTLTDSVPDAGKPTVPGSGPLVSGGAKTDPPPGPLSPPSSGVWTPGG